LFDEKNNIRPIKKIGFISRDFSQGRPSGQLAEQFFKLLSQETQQTIPLQEETIPLLNQHQNTDGVLGSNVKIDIYFYTFPLSASRLFKQFATVREAKNIHRLAELIYADKLDILIDMQGHMHNNFNVCLNKKPAPIIMHWLGYPGTTGIKEVDYLFADETIVPIESQCFYREKIIYLPNCYQINNPKFLVSNDNCCYTRQDLNYPQDGILFAHFNDSYKVDKNTWLVWCEILKKVPNSYLVFLKKYEKETASFIETAVQNGVKLEQLIITKRLDRNHHIHRLNLLNIGLDPYYCNGHTTSSDLIAAGIPVVTFPGKTYQSRVTLSILKSLHLEELAVDSWDQYIDLAVKLGTDKEYYQYVCQKIIDNREKTLYNPELYVKNWLTAINKVWYNQKPIYS